jgi:hypothetical protein
VHFTYGITPLARQEPALKLRCASFSLRCRKSYSDSGSMYARLPEVKRPASAVTAEHSAHWAPAPHGSDGDAGAVAECASRSISSSGVSISLTLPPAPGLTLS